MNKTQKYRTRQRDAVLSYIQSTDGGHVTAADVAGYLRNSGHPVGTTTVYRQLEHLVSLGVVKKYVTDGLSAACYQYIAESEDCGSHHHLKCEDCGSLIHLDCNLLDDIGKHIRASHGFRIDPNKTVFYGKCGDCTERAESKEV